MLERVSSSLHYWFSYQFYGAETFWRVSVRIFPSASRCPWDIVGWSECAAGWSRWLFPFRWAGRLPGPRLLPPGHLPEQPPVPGLAGPAGRHPAEPRWVTRRQVLLWPNQALGGEGQHAHHPGGKPLQQQVAAVNVAPYLCSCVVWEKFSQRFYLCFNMRRCFWDASCVCISGIVPTEVFCCDLQCGLDYITLSFISILSYWQCLEGSFHGVQASEVYILWRQQSRKRENANWFTVRDWGITHLDLLHPHQLCLTCWLRKLLFSQCIKLNLKQNLFSCWQSVKQGLQIRTKCSVQKSVTP